MPFPKGGKRAGPGGKMTARPKDTPPDAAGEKKESDSGGMPAPSAPEPKPVEDTIRAAEKKAADEERVEQERKAAMKRQRACLSCGTMLEDGKCPECGAEAQGGRQVAKPPKPKPRKKTVKKEAEAEPPKRQGLFETLWQ